MPSRTAVGVALGALLAIPAGSTLGQPAPLETLEVPYDVESGFIPGGAAVANGASFMTVIRVPGAAWLRLNFDQVVSYRTRQ